jgi:hypothetical protein
MSWGPSERPPAPAHAREVQSRVSGVGSAFARARVRADVRGGLLYGVPCTTAGICLTAECFVCMCVPRAACQTWKMSVTTAR